MTQKSHNSFSAIHESVSVNQNTSVWKKIMAFFAPAYLISVGYMDPDNGATNLTDEIESDYKLNLQNGITRLQANKLTK